MHDWVFSLVLITSKGQVGIEASAPARPAQTKYLKYESFAFFNGLKMRIAIQSMSSAIAWGTYHVVKGLVSPV